MTKRLHVSSDESLHSAPQMLSITDLGYCSDGQHAITFKIRNVDVTNDAYVSMTKCWFVEVADLEHLAQELLKAAEQAKAIREKYHEVLPTGV